MESYLKIALASKNSLSAISQFCTRKATLCNVNPRLVCRKILKLSGYNVFTPEIDECGIVAELKKLTSKIPRSGKLKSVLSMDGYLTTAVKEEGSLLLKVFLNLNGYSFNTSTGKISKFSKVKSLFKIISDEKYLDAALRALS